MVCVSLKNSFTTHLEPEWKLPGQVIIVCDNSWITIGIDMHYVAHDN